MLFATSLLLPLLASAAVIGERDVAAAEIAEQLASAQAVNVVVEKLEPKVRKGANRNRYKVGPYTLNVGSTSQGQSFFYKLPKQLCNTNGACTVLAASTGVIFADGKTATPADGIYIHHILTSDSTKVTTNWVSNCGSPNSKAMNIAGLLGGTAFVGTGEDSSEGGALYTSEDGRAATGYHIGAQDSFTGWADIVNYNKVSKSIYVFYDLEWIPGIVGKDVKQATLTATCGGSPAIALSKTGATNTTSGKFYFMEDGDILGGKGHLHDGGVQVAVYVNDKFLCKSDAIYGPKGAGTDSGMGGKPGEGMAGHSHGGGAAAPASAAPAAGTVAQIGGTKTISAMTRCEGPFPVKKGDSLKLVAVYDLAKHPLRDTGNGKGAADVMGMMGISFSPNK